MDTRIGQFRAHDKTKLHYEHWSPPQFEKALILVHGIGDHCGRYGPFTRYFTERGYRVCLFDQRGHGKSEGKRGHIDRFATYLDDLEQYVLFCRQGAASSVRWYLVGHSFGGQLVLNFLARRPTLFYAACATSPNLQVAISMPKWKETLAKKLLDLWPTMKLKGLVRPEWLSHDPKIVQTYERDPLVSSFITIKVGHEIVKNLETIFSLCTILQTPLLMLHGSQDRICSLEGTRRFFNELVLAQKELKIYEGMYHELLNETEREKAFDDIHRWFDKLA